MSTQAILSSSGITQRFGGFVALRDINFALSSGERVGLIGPNGSGKSTFVNCLTGTIAPQVGRVVLDSVDITSWSPWRRAQRGLGRSFQIPRPFRGMTVRQNIEVPLSFISRLHDRDTIEAKAQDVLSRVGLGDKAGLSPTRLNQVELRRLELARAIAPQPRVLISDEAMAGLSDSEVDEILDLLMMLNESGVAVVLIEHIMRAVIRFSQRVIVFVAGSKIADGEPDEVMTHPEVVKAYLGQ